MLSEIIIPTSVEQNAICLQNILGSSTLMCRGQLCSPHSLLSDSHSFHHLFRYLYIILLFILHVGHVGHASLKCVQDLMSVSLTLFFMFIFCVRIISYPFFNYRFLKIFYLHSFICRSFIVLKKSLILYELWTRPT